MRRLFLTTAIQISVLASGVSFAAAASAAPQDAPPPPAPIFYCPLPDAVPPIPAKPALACPSPRSRAFRARHVLRVRHGLRVRVAGVERPYNPEDDGVSTSQAWVYRYELAHHGLHAWEVDGRWGLRTHPEWAQRSAPAEDRSYAWDSPPPAHDERQAWTSRQDDDAGDGRGEAHHHHHHHHAVDPDARMGGADHDDRAYAYGGEAVQGGSSDRERDVEPGYDDREEGQRYVQREFSGDDERQAREAREAAEPRGGDRDDHRYAYEHRQYDNGGGRVEGERDGRAYAHAWGDSGEGAQGGYGEPGDYRQGWSDRYGRSDHDASGYAHHSGGGYSYTEEGGDTGWQGGPVREDGYGWSQGGYAQTARGGYEQQGYAGGDTGYGLEDQRYGYRDASGYGRQGYGQGSYDQGYYDDQNGYYGQGPYRPDDQGGQPAWRTNTGGGYEVYSAAGRDAQGYLTWAGKPRAPGM